MDEADARARGGKHEAPEWGLERGAIAHPQYGGLEKIFKI